MRVYEKYMFVVGMLGQILYYAQAFKIFRDHSAEDVSLIGFLFGLGSVTSWLIYGILIKNKVLIAANIVAVLGAVLVIMGILTYS